MITTYRLMRSPFVAMAMVAMAISNSFCMAQDRPLWAEPPISAEVAEKSLQLRRGITNKLAASVSKLGATFAALLIMDVRTGKMAVQVEWAPGDEIAWPRMPDEFISRGLLPGDAMIPLTAALALEEGNSLQDQFDARSSIQIGDLKIGDSREIRRFLTIEEAVLYSSHVAAAKIAIWCGTPAQRHFLRRLGIDDKINPGQVMIPHPWREVNTMHVSFGESILISPEVLLRAYAALVNGGFTFSAGSGVAMRAVGENTSATMRELLRSSVLKGRAKGAHLNDMEVGGVAAVLTDFRPANPVFFTGESKRKFPAFIGAFPINDPRFAMIVILEGLKVPAKNFETAGAPVAAEIISSAAPLLGLM